MRIDDSRIHLDRRRIWVEHVHERAGIHQFGVGHDYQLIDVLITVLNLI